MKLLYPPSSPSAAAPEAYDDLFGKGCRYENAFDAVGDKVMATEVIYCKSKLLNCMRGYGWFSSYVGRMLLNP